MSFLDLSSIDSKALEVTSNKLEPGKYLVSCKKAYIEKLKNKRGERLVCVFEVMDGKYKGSVIYHGFIFKHESNLAQTRGLSFLKEFLLNSDKPQLKLQTPEELIGKFVCVNLTLEMYNEKQRPTISSFEPVNSNLKNKDLPNLASAVLNDPSPFDF